MNSTLTRYSILLILFAPPCIIGQTGTTGNMNSNYIAEDDPTVKEWSATDKLNYSDFEGTIDTTSNLISYIAAGIKMNLIYGGKDKMEYRVVALMYKLNSWANFKDTNRNDLYYERDLFDIAEVDARELRQALVTTPISYEDTIVNTLNNEYCVTKLQADWNNYANAISNFSTYREDQRKYEIKIQHELDSLDAYKNPLVTIKPQ